MARRGTFGSGLTPFGGANTDLSVYQIGAKPLTPTPYPTPTYTAPDPPPAPSVAPEVGVMPVPVIPTVVSPYVRLREEADAIAARAALVGKTPTAETITATQAKTSVALAAELEAIRQRALAAGKNPTYENILRTYQLNLAGR